MPTIFNPFTGKLQFFSENGIAVDPGTLTGDILRLTGPGSVGAVTAIPESLIVSNDEIISFSNTGGTNEVGSSVASANFNWVMTRDANANISQQVSGTNLVGSPVSVTPGTARILAGSFSPALSPASAQSYTYTLNTVGDDSYADSASTSISFRWRRYWGVSNLVLATDVDVLANLSGEFGSSRGVTKTFNASSGTPPNYLYFCYPTSWGLPSITYFGGFAFSDYTNTTIVSFTNASGGQTDYYLIRTNNTYSSSGLVWQLV